MLQILIPALWAGLAVYVAWYFTSAKHYAPITTNEVKILWKIHKQNTQCKGKRWREIRRGGKIVGFQCECGHKHLQKRPVVGNRPTLNNNSQGLQSSIVSKLHNSYS